MLYRLPECSLGCGQRRCILLRYTQQFNCYLDQEGMETDIKKEKTIDKKARIREKYKGVDQELLEVIPAKPKPGFYDEDLKRVAIYARVSTDDVRQTSSYELQKNYYMDLVDQHPNWTLVDIYADEGISGTSLRKRDAFNRMIQDCYEGKIDMIVTKSISRFARNLVDFVDHIRKLKALTPPVGVWFQSENMFSLDDDKEMGVALMATFAQEESHTKSNIMNMSLEMRFKHGIFLTPPLLGYDNDENGNLVLNEEEAKTVRLIFYMYLSGYSCSEIAETLMHYGRLTKKGNTKWTSGSVLNVLQNERHCGEVLSWKTYTPNYLDHASKKNKGDKPQVRQANHHVAIVTPEDFVAVQRMISNAKYGSKGLLPELHVIRDGFLKGFVGIHTRWGSFTKEDYEEASRSAGEEKDEGKIRIQAEDGDIDFRGFEVAREQFFDVPHRVCATFSLKEIRFSTECLRKLEDPPFVELLIHPDKKQLCVRSCKETQKNKVRWGKKKDGQLTSISVAGSAFLKTLYEILKWDTSLHFRVRGSRYKKDETSVLIFDLGDTEVLMPAKEMYPDSPPHTAVVAYSKGIAEGFGKNYYEHTLTNGVARQKMRGSVLNTKGTKVKLASSISVSTKDELDGGIKEILGSFAKEAQAT